MDERFGKKYKLCSKIVIASLFEKGNQIKSYPFALRYIPTKLNTNTPFQIAISVPKKSFKKATDRNRIKRVVREAVRKNKHIVENAIAKEEQQLALFLIYTAQKEEPYQTINNKIESLFLRLIDDVR